MVAKLAIDFHSREGRVPSTRELVGAYYDEDVGPADLFIGFDKFCAFDMPLIASGNEDLYFTVSPSPYLSARQLRDILYDHLYARAGEPDYESMGEEDWQFMRDYYGANQDRTLGVGRVMGRGGVWFPTPQVVLPHSSNGADQDHEAGDKHGPAEPD
jgi:hypothetical protein